MSIAENISHVHDRIAVAARRAGRNPQEIALLAVSKTFPAGHIRQAYEAGIRIFGENRVQEFATKAEAVRELRDAQWHMIGHLQTNKATKAVELFSAVDSVDSVKLAEKLNLAAQKIGKKLEVVIEVKVGGEEAKSGIAPDKPELEQIRQDASQLEHLPTHSLMRIDPLNDNPLQ